MVLARKADNFAKWVQIKVGLDSANSRTLYSVFQFTNKHCFCLVRFHASVQFFWSYYFFRNSRNFSTVSMDPLENWDKITIPEGIVSEGKKPRGLSLTLKLRWGLFQRAGKESLCSECSRGAKRSQQKSFYWTEDWVSKFCISVAGFTVSFSIVIRMWSWSW